MAKQKIKAGFIVKAAAAAVLLLLAGFALWTGGSEEPDESKIGVDIYYLDSATNTLQPETHYVTRTDNSQLATEVIRLLYEGPKAQTLSKIFSEDVRFLDGRIVVNESADDTVMELEFSQEYLDMPPTEEQFFRASLVWSMTGLGFIDGMIIYIGDSELLRSDGEPMGRLNRQNTLLNPVVLPVRAEPNMMTLDPRKD